MKKIIYHPSRYFGGASVLFFRLFWLSGNKDFYLIDCPNGFTHGKIGKNNRLILNTDSEKLLEIITAEDIIICISTQMKNLINDLRHIKVNPKILIWIVHPYEASLIFFPFAKKITSNLGYTLGRQYIKMHIKKYQRIREFILRSSGFSVFFMDSACIRATEYFLNIEVTDEKYERSILPIPYISTSLDGNKLFLKNEQLHFGYLGRVEDFKYPPLCTLIDDLIKIDVNAVLHIIGNGRDLEKIKAKYSKKINLIFLGEMDNLDAKRYIYNNIDVMFCMGTAALDSASMRIPTVLLNPSNEVMTQKYKWLYNTNGYTLGDYLDSPWFKEEGKDLSVIIEEAKCNIDLQSKLSYQYVSEYHSIESVIKQVEVNANKCNILLNDLRNIF